MTTRALSLLLALSLLTGCASTVVTGDGGTATWTWYRAQLETVLVEPLPAVEKAAAAALEGLDFVAVESVTDKLKGEVTARMADGTKISVHLKSLAPEQTRIRIRVGTLGDRAVSEQTLRHIEQRLK